MLRALEAATSMLKTVESVMRRRPIKVPSRSATAMTIFAREARGRRMAARVVLAVGSAAVRGFRASVSMGAPPRPLGGGGRMPYGGRVVLGLALDTPRASPVIGT